jgi:hypothetical protein
MDEQDPWDEDPVKQLPEVIEAGSINVTLWTSALGGDPVAHDTSFTWDGQHTAEWWQDISSVNDLSPGSSSPARGIASWPDGSDVLLTYTWDDLGMQGHDRLPGVAPTSGGPDGSKDPRLWVDFADALLDFVLLDLGNGRDTPEEWSAQYLDTVQDTKIDFHDVFRDFLKSAEGQSAGTDFDQWLTNAVAAGTYQRL